MARRGTDVGKSDSQGRGRKEHRATLDISSVSSGAGKNSRSRVSKPLPSPDVSISVSQPVSQSARVRRRRKLSGFDRSQSSLFRLPEANQSEEKANPSPHSVQQANPFPIFIHGTESKERNRFLGHIGQARYQINGYAHECQVAFVTDQQSSENSNPVPTLYFIDLNTCDRKEFPRCYEELKNTHFVMVVFTYTIEEECEEVLDSGYSCDYNNYIDRIYHRKLNEAYEEYFTEFIQQYCEVTGIYIDQRKEKMIYDFQYSQFEREYYKENYEMIKDDIIKKIEKIFFREIFSQKLEADKIIPGAKPIKFHKVLLSKEAQENLQYFQSRLIGAGISHMLCGVGERSLTSEVNDVPRKLYDMLNSSDSRLAAKAQPQKRKESILYRTLGSIRGSLADNKVSLNPLKLAEPTLDNVQKPKASSLFNMSYQK